MQEVIDTPTIDLQSIEIPGESKSDLLKKLPKIDFRRLKLKKINHVESCLEKKNVSVDHFEDKLCKMNLGYKRVVKESEVEDFTIKPLRKKGVKSQEVVEKEEAKEENFSLPKKQETLSEEAKSSEPSSEFAWPPKLLSATKSETKASSKKRKSKKPYFIESELEEKVVKPESKNVENNALDDLFIGDSSNKSESSKPVGKEAFPWEANDDAYRNLEDVFSGGLESELVDSDDSTDDDIEKERTIDPGLQIFKEKPKEIVDNTEQINSLDLEDEPVEEANQPFQNEDNIPTEEVQEAPPAPAQPIVIKAIKPNIAQN